jgi:hypothetical protein
MDFESDADIFKWITLFFGTTILLLILPCHWRASWRRDAWWPSATHGIQLNTHRPTFSIPWSKNRPQSKKLLGRRQNQGEYNCQIKCSSFENLQRLFVQLLWMYEKCVAVKGDHADWKWVTFFFFRLYVLLKSDSLEIYSSTFYLIFAWKHSKRKKKYINKI